MSATDTAHLAEPRPADIRVEAVLAALSDPVRLSIVRTLAADEVGSRPCGSFGLAVGKSTASHHFRVLREAGVIEQWREGAAKLSSLRRADLEARFPGLLDAVLAPAAVA